MCALGAGVPLGKGLYRPLSEPVEVWHFDMRCPPEESGRKTVDVEFVSDGVCNAVVFWFGLELIDGITISSAPGRSSAPGQTTIATNYLVSDHFCSGSVNVCMHAWYMSHSRCEVLAQIFSCF